MKLKKAKAVYYETTNYDMFTLHPINREVERVHHLKKTMKQVGFDDAYPLNVVWDRDENGDVVYLLKDGHHRLEVARQLGIPVVFRVKDDNGLSIQDLNNAVLKWTTREYVKSYADQGFPDYIDLYNYCNRTGIRMHIAANMMMNLTSYGGNLSDKIAEGHFRIVKQGWKTAEFVATCVAILDANGCEVATKTHLVSALSKVALVPQLDKSLLKKKLKTYARKIKINNNVAEYLDNITHVYNYRTAESKKLMLQILVAEVMRKRKEDAQQGSPKRSEQDFVYK